MKIRFSKVVRFLFVIPIIFSSATPIQTTSAKEINTGQSQISSVENIELPQVLVQQTVTPQKDAYTVVQNADAYLMSLALGNEETISRYGPDRNDPAEGIPTHAYSPFDEPEKREVCPPGGCDYVEGRVLIKFDSNQTLIKRADKGIVPQDATLAATLESLEISSLTPIFPNAEKPAPGALIETIDGQLIAKPDLTLWFQGETKSTKGLAEVMKQLQSTTGITSAEPDFIRKPIGEMETTLAAKTNSELTLPGSSSDPLYNQQWHLAATHVPEAWAYLESQGLPAGGSRDIIVAVVDTGVDYTHPDLAANIWVNPAEFNGLPGVDDDGNGYVDDIHGADTVYPDGDPMDDHGHGTHVAGIIAAQANNGIGGVGVAYNVQIMPIKAAQYSGVLAASDIAEAIYYAVAKGADVINMSFGGYAKSQVEEDALAVAFGQAVLVAAAGNDGKANLPCPLGIDMYPAAYNWVLGVMASNNANGLASFSNFDCTPHDTHEYELMAPGVSIWSTLPSDQYAAWSGTSMATPIISGIAALARTKWSDPDVYSSRFIMGQIASNTTQAIGGVANALEALTVPPSPELSYLQHWLFDTPDLNPINDNDGISDAGETVDLAIVIRNHWGKADNVTVTLEPWAEGAMSPDPYVTMLIDTVNYGAIGSFNWDDNGLIYNEEGLIVGIEHPFRFTTAADTPNDHLIPFRLTITAENGYDPQDPQAPYTFIDHFYLLVQRGREIPRIITADMVLSKDYYWLVSDSVLITQGTTVTVTEGTQIQFFSGDPEDPYSQTPKPSIQVEGNLFVQGTAVEPIEFFTGLLWQGYPIQIFQVEPGTTEFNYIFISNPYLGSRIDLYGSSSSGEPLDLINHAYFTQDVRGGIKRYVYYGKPPYWDNGYYGTARVYARDIEHTIFFKVGGWEELIIYNGDENLFDSTFIKFNDYDESIPQYLFLFKKTVISNSVLLINGFTDENGTSNYSRAYSGLKIHYPSFLTSVFPTVYDGNTYFATPRQIYPPPSREDYELQNGSLNFIQASNIFANKLGGGIVSITNQIENDFISFYTSNILTQEAFETFYSDMNCGSPIYSGPDSCWNLFSGNQLMIGLNNHNSECEYRWMSGEPVEFISWRYPPSDPCTEKFVSIDASGFWNPQNEVAYPILIEVPGIIDEQIIENARDQIINDGSLSIKFYNNAILNDWMDPDTSHWMKFYNELPREYARIISKNYWGTASTDLIDAAIVDFNDDFNRGPIIYQPILTTPPETTYPFVADVVLSTAADPDTSVVGAEPVTFTIRFNRDMDQTIQPQVSFGPDIPMTDYTVHPLVGGWLDARTWVGSFNITPVTGDGYQLIRVAGAVAADDPWLVTGDDAGRFRFEIITSGSEAMNLQSTGGEGYVDLMWTQSDFDLLAGFNLYRSTSLDGSYTRINSSIIPPDVRTYRDTDVLPGQPYYYKFTVVKTDMTESDFSNTSSATPLDTIPPMLIHTPVTSAEPGLPLTLTAIATDNVAVSSVTLFYRHIGESNYLNAIMVRTTGDSYYTTIDGSYLSSPGVEYYIEATDGISITRNGRAENPNRVSVIDRPVVTIVTPNSGPTAGGTAVTISGSNFKLGATITFGGAAASNIVFISANQLSCTTPAHIPSTVDVRVTNPDQQYGVLLNGFTYISTSAQVSLPNSGGGTGNVITIPVNAANIHGLIAASLTLNFDPSVLNPQSASTGSLTAGWAFAANLSVPGQVRLSMSSSSAVDGAGILANIEFEIIGAPGSSSALTISNILLNDGAIPVELGAGMFNVDNVYNVSGQTTFWNGGTAVPGTTLTLTGDHIYEALSDSEGNYIIQGAAIDSYVLVPSKQDGDNGISAYDASFALQHDVGLITLSGSQAIAADVNSNGNITSMDAAYILQKAAGLISLPFPGSGVVWKFEPPQRNIAELTEHLPGQDFTGILLGDISGNWTNPGTLGQPINNNFPQTASATLTIPEVNVLPNGSVDVPILLEITDAELLGADITFTYDPTHVSISNVRLGSLAAGWGIASNLTEQGVARIALAGAMPITSDGQLVVFTATALGEPGTESELTLTRGELNEGAIPSDLVSNYIYINGYKILLPLIVK